jgi:hypothetical protein
MHHFFICFEFVLNMTFVQGLVDRFTPIQTLPLHGGGQGGGSLKEFVSDDIEVVVES